MAHVAEAQDQLKKNKNIYVYIDTKIFRYT